MRIGAAGVVMRAVQCTVRHALLASLVRWSIPVTTLVWWPMPVTAQSAAGMARSHRVTHRVPTQLADSTFWRLVTALSEPAGWFRSENYVSNETAWQHVIAPLRTVVPAGHAYIGVGPEQNFTYIAALEPSIAFIVDIRQQNLALHLYYKALFELSPSRSAFLSRLFARAQPAGLDSASSVDALLNAFEDAAMDSARHVRTIADVIAHLTSHHGFTVSGEALQLLQRVAWAFAMAGPQITYSYIPEYGPPTMVARGMPSFSTLMRQDDGAGVNRSFLGSEAVYRAVRTMHERNLIVPVTGDFAGAHALAAVGDWLRAHDALVGTFYLSNVEQYLFQDNTVWPRFYANVARLPLDTSSTFIRSISSQWGRGMVSRGANVPLMAQQLGPMRATVEAFRGGSLLWYGDVIALVRQ
jgi:hypothetical protein